MSAVATVGAGVVARASGIRFDGVSVAYGRPSSSTPSI